MKLSFLATFAALALSAGLVRAQEISTFSVLSQMVITPSALQEALVKVKSPTDEGWTKSLTSLAHFSAFLLHTPEGSLQPAVLLQGPVNTAELPPVFHALHFAAYKDWQVGTPEGLALPDSFVEQTLVPLAVQTPPAPLFLTTSPSLIIKALRSDKEFESKITGTFVGALMDELATVETLEVRATPNPQNFRTVFLIKSLDNSALNTFLSQRLKADLPPEHTLFPVGKADLYGYFSYNASATKDYLTHLSQMFAPSLPLSANQLLAVAQKMENARGYTAFAFYSGEPTARLFHLGDWSVTSAPETMKAGYCLLNPLAKAEEVEMTQSFLIGNHPVWRLTPPQSNLLKQPAWGKPLYFALMEGNLAQAGSPELLNQLIQDITPPGAFTQTLSKSFGHLPTVCFQAKYKSGSLLKTLLIDSRTTPVDKNLYTAASLGDGKLALTIDFPYELLPALMNLAAQSTVPPSSPASEATP